MAEPLDTEMPMARLASRPDAVLVVGTMCHCDEPDECDDHWELYLCSEENAAYSAENEGHVGRAWTMRKSDLDEIVRRLSDG